MANQDGWAHIGKKTAPTISWGQPSTFRFCFDAIEKNSIVAIGMIGCKHDKISFMKGYQAMLNIVEPEAIICFGKPFSEMKGNIIVVDYASSRKAVRHGR